MTPSLSVLLWNTEWATPNSPRGREIQRRIAAASPDLVCLTEAVPALLPPHGHTLSSHPDYGYGHHPAKRKVLLWSPSPFQNPDAMGHPALPSGRYLHARLPSPLGPLAVTAVCIPWAHAHVSTGRRDRRPWQDHLAYLAALAELRRNPSPVPELLLGDFNQSLPTGRAPAPARQLLLQACRGLEIPTAGPLPSAPCLSIDHLAHAPTLAATVTEIILGLSDHYGLVLQLTSQPQ